MEPLVMYDEHIPALVESDIYSLQENIPNSLDTTSLS